MASVLFLVRIPCQENLTYSKPEGKSESISSDESKGTDVGQRTDDIKDDHPNENIKKIKDETSDSQTDESMLYNETETSDDTNVADQTATDVEIFNSPLNLAKVLQDQLKSLNVEGDSWTVTKDKQFHQVAFLEKTGKRVETILERLTSVGIGKRPKSSVSIIPTSVHIQPQEIENTAVKKISQTESTLHSVETETEPLLGGKEISIKEQFIKSIKSRLTVEQVVEGVRLQAILTFDFMMFTILASMIAAVGLAEDNAVVLVASILVSPLMGPILGATFGIVIKNKNLRNTGLKTEICGLILSVVVGFLFGLICGPFGVNGASWDTTKDIWPTNEMSSRGKTRGLWVGILIALPSGAGVALSVLGGNTGSLVGVAISASLLAPAVNSGMLWAYSIIAAVKPPELLVNADFNVSMSKCPPFKDNTYMPTYSCDMGTEATIMAIISFALTLVNIICICMTATLVLKIKEVTPKASSSNATQTFWTKDIKVAREAYQTLHGDQATNFLKEWKKLNERTKEGSPDSLEKRDKRTEEVSRDSLELGKELLDIFKEVEETEDYQSVVRRAPRASQNVHKFSKGLERHISQHDEKTAEKEAEQLQNTLRNLQTQYTQQPKEKERQPHVRTIFNEQESKPRRSVREFHVVETEKPHHKSVVRVHPPTDDSKRPSITTESGV